MDTVEQLQALPALRDCARGDLLAFATAAPVLRFDAGTILITQGEQTGGALLLLEGACRAEVQHGGRRIVLGRIGPGEVLGELGLYTASLRRSATVVTEEDVVVLALEPAILDDPRARPVMGVLEQRALATMAERVRRNTANLRRRDAPGDGEAPGSFFSSMVQAMRKLVGG